MDREPHSTRGKIARGVELRRVCAHHAHCAHLPRDAVARRHALIAAGQVLRAQKRRRTVGVVRAGALGRELAHASRSALDAALVQRAVPGLRALRMAEPEKAHERARAVAVQLADMFGYGTGTARRGIGAARARTRAARARTRAARAGIGERGSPARAGRRSDHRLTAAACKDENRRERANELPHWSSGVSVASAHL